MSGAALVVIYGIALHLIWGIILLVAGAQHTAGLSWAVDVMGGANAAGVILIAAALAAMAGIKAKTISTKLGLLLWQQFIMTYAAGEALTCVVNGAYADGTVRPRMFILADQVNLILPAILHVIAVVVLVTEGVTMPWTRARLRR